MTNYDLETIDHEDLDDFLVKLQDSFKIQFDKKEFTYVKTYEALENLVLSKIENLNVEDCTSQQLFYRLRSIISKTLNVEEKLITPTSLLNEIIPRNNRRQNINLIEEKLGFKLKTLRPRKEVSNFLLFCIILSLITLFINWKIALAGFIISLISTRIEFHFGKEFKDERLSTLLIQNVKENYILSRKNSQTSNRAEVKNILQIWFKEEFVST